MKGTIFDGAEEKPKSPTLKHRALGTRKFKTKTRGTRQEIRRGFALRHPKLECADNANVAGLGWMHDSTTALFVAQIPPIPDCGRTWGYFDVYAVSVRTGRIVGVYPMAEALMRFKRLLGPGVRRDVPELPKASKSEK